MKKNPPQQMQLDLQHPQDDATMVGSVLVYAENTGPTFEPAGGLISDAVTTAVPGGWFLKNWKLVLSLAIILGTVGTIWWQSNKIDKLEQQIAVEQLSKEFIQNELDHCKKQYDDLNRNIANLSTDSKKLQDSLDGLKPVLSKIRTNTNTTVEEILKKPTPESCDAAMDFIREYGHIFEDWSTKK